MKMISVYLIVLLLLAGTLLSCRQSTLEPPSVEPSAQTEENPTPLLKLEVEWETSGPLPEARNVATVVIDDNKGEIIYAIGQRGEIRPVSVWKSETGGESWEYLGKITNPEIHFRNKDEVYKKFVVGTQAPGLRTGWSEEREIIFFEFHDPDNPTRKKVDPNNKEIVLKPNITGRVKVTSIREPKTYTWVATWEFLLSFNGGESFFRIDLPSPYVNNVVNMELRDYALISSEGKLKIFFAVLHEVWYTRISLPQ